MVELLKEAVQNETGATVFGYHVTNTEQFGVVIDSVGKVISIEEKQKT